MERGGGGGALPLPEQRSGTRSEGRENLGYDEDGTYRNCGSSPTEISVDARRCESRRAFVDLSRHEF